MFELLSFIDLTIWLALASCPVALTHCCCNIDPCLARCVDILGNCTASTIGNRCSFGCVSGGGYFNGPCNGIPSWYIEPPHIFDTLTVDIANGIVGHTTLQVYMTLQNLDVYVWWSDDLGVSPITCQPLGPVACHWVRGPASDGSEVGSPFGRQCRYVGLGDYVAHGLAAFGITKDRVAWVRGLFGSDPIAEAARSGRKL